MRPQGAVHKRVRIDQRVTKCRIKGFAVYKWQLVTCVLCLARKPRGPT